MVLQGKGLDQRGYKNIRSFGPLTLRQINRRIRKWARWCGLKVSVFQSNSAEQLVHRLVQAENEGVTAVVRHVGAKGRRCGCGRVWVWVWVWVWV